MNIHESVYVARGASIIGDVTVGADSGIWPCAVLRGDVAPIIVGARTNIQDGAILHGNPSFTVRVGDDVTIGHGAIVHGCTVDNGSLIGMGAILLDGCHVGAGCLVAAGALVPPGMEIPPGMMAVGNPARVKRPTTEAEQELLAFSAVEYMELAEERKRTEGAG